MKKLLALALVVFGLAACQTEPQFDVQMGGEQEVMLTVSLPEATRASSASDALTNGVLSTHSLRYILEVYRVNDDAVLYDTCQRFVETSKNTSMVFPVRLAPGYDYRIVAWTDIVEGDSKEDRYYYTEEGLDNVVIKDNGTVNWNAMDETRDAYTCVKVVDDFSSASNLDMTLTRPFAKLRVVATDIEDIRKVGLVPTTATVKYTQDMYVKYNAVEDKCIADGAKKKEHEYTYATTASKYEDVNSCVEYTLFSDYIFVPSTGTAKFELTVKDADGNIINKEIGSFNTEISVERNKLTTIKGDVLTIGGNITVNVNGFLEEGKTYTYVDTAEDLQQMISNAPENKNTNISLGGDIDLGDLLSAGILSTRAAATLPIVIPEGKVVTLDLNGYKITTPFVEGSTTNHAYAFENHGNLTIKNSKGNGEIKARGIFNYGTMTLESGTINACDGNGGYGVRNYEGAEFIMNGGSIVTSYEDGDEPTKGYDASPVRVDEGATATINGGVINNVSNYTVAIDNHGTTTINDGTFTTIHTTIANSASMTINGGSFTCNGLEGITAHALWAAAGTTTINGGIFDGKDNYNGFNVSASAGAEVNIYGGVFNRVHSGSLYGEGTINVMGGTFFDDPSLRVVKGYVVEKNGDVFEVSQIALEAKFADNSWDKIILACQNDIVPETWAVGNKKEMTIGDKEYAIRIIGKNHDTYTAGGRAPLTFQIAEVCGSAAMNATQTNTTGWSGSQMRTVTMPEILAAMPVKDAIKAVNKETLNGTRDGLETTSDKLFLLSEVEVNGSVYFSNNFAEGSRYAFYTGLDSQIMNASYWLRGPGKNNAIGFTQINISGYMANGSAEYACGVVFGFCF
ncbi:MAG: hypothetical protein J6U59_07060 [Alistipes sp.]|nr:hypothetical protein [Alistipes sp.]